MTDLEKPRGLDAHIEAAIEASEAPAVVDTPEAPDAAAPDSETAASQPGRDERGRFAPKSEAAAAPEGTPAPESVESAAPVAEAPAEASKEISEGHFRGWSPEQRAKFDRLPPEAKDIVLSLKKETEARITPKLMEAAKIKEVAEPIVRTLAEDLDFFRAQGMTPLQAYEGYRNIEKVLTFGTYNEKRDLIQKICQRYQIPLGDDVGLDPAFDPLSGETQAVLHDKDAELARTRYELQELRGRLDSYETARIGSTIESFATATAADGSPAYPHFSVVRPAMAALIRDGKANTLEEAYAMASAPIQAAIDARLAAAKADLMRTQSSAIERAKAASPVRGTPAMPSGHSRSKGLDDAINSALDAAGL